MSLDRRRWPLDRSDFLGKIQDKAQLLREGHAAGMAGADEALSARGLLFSGMGFSGVSAELVRDACGRTLDVPLSIVKHYQFPRHVQKDWHVLALSYSGETEETLTIARTARRRGVPLTAFTTGGSLQDLADHVVRQPSGYPPRAALGYAWFSVLGYLQGSGLLREEVPVAAAAAAVQEVDDACGPHVPTLENEAKQLAKKLSRRIPQIYATPALYGIGLHFRGMLNENAKKIAGVELVPECNHNDLTGWGGDPNRRRFTVLVLSHANQNPEIVRRIQFMRQRYRGWGLPWHHHVAAPIDSFQDHVVEQARTMQFLDYTSFYTAMLRHKDPSTIREIRGLKAFLRHQRRLGE